MGNLGRSGWGWFWGAEQGFFLLLWLGLLVTGRSGLFHDPGTFWHTVVGERLLSTHQLIYTDSYSFTFAGRPWIAHQWLGECLMALVHRVDGFDSLLLATATLLAGLYTWVAHRLLRAGLHWSLVGVLVLVTLAASSSHFHVRPHLATIIGVGITVAFLCDFEAGCLRLSQLFWLVPVYLVWANIHGGMLGGLCTMILAAAGWALLAWLGRENPLRTRSRFAALGLLIMACGLVSFVNPYGWRLPWTWLSIMDSPLLPHIIREHAPLDITKPYAWAVVLLGLIYLLALASAWPRWRISWLLPLVWLVLAWTRVRHTPLFAVAAAVSLADILPHTHWVARLIRSGSDWFQLPAQDDAKARPSRWRPALVPVLAVLLALFLQLERIAAPVVGHGWARLDPVQWPVALLPDLRRLEPGAIFNEYADGGFLIYFTPGLRVFVDDRCELYGDAWLRDYVAAEAGDVASHMQVWQAEYRKGHAVAFDYALTRAGSAFDDYFQTADGWRVRRRTEIATLYQRIPTPCPKHSFATA